MENINQNRIRRTIATLAVLTQLYSFALSNERPIRTNSLANQTTSYSQNNQNAQSREASLDNVLNAVENLSNLERLADENEFMVQESSTTENATDNTDNDLTYMLIDAIVNEYDSRRQR